MRVQRSSGAAQVLALSPAAQDCLAREMPAEAGCCTVAGVSQDGSTGWLARGSALEVFSMSTGDRIAAWCFGAALKEPNTVVTAVCECYYDNSIKLVVATLAATSDSAMICLFDVKHSRVVKAIEFPNEVTSLLVVSSVGAEQAPAVILSEHLRCYCGVLAVGTDQAHIFLIDLCLDIVDEEEASDELSPASLAELDPRTADVATLRYKTVSHSKHLCLELGEDCHRRGYFYYRKPDGGVIKTYSEGDICVSSLSFVRQTGLLLVGFSFGCFQFWRLYIPVLEYSSRLEDTMAPVTHFTYQEPENDPRNYCYVWIVRGPLLHHNVRDYTSSMSLFQLGYSRKAWYNGFGYLYEELVSVGPRFVHDLTSDPFSGSAMVEGAGSRVVCCFTLQDPRYNAQLRGKGEDGEDEADFEEGSGGPDLSLCAFVWETEAPDPHSKSPCYLALFDMNRWYHAQMPSAIRMYGGGHDLCPYLAAGSLDAAQETLRPSSIKGGHIAYNKLFRFKSPLVPAPEQLFFPSSLAFEVSCVSETGVAACRFLGVQRQILSELEQLGPTLLLEPHEVFNLCLQSGLMPRTLEVTAAVTPLQKREALMTAALDHNLVRFLTDCITQWSTAESTAVGCTNRSLLEWAWKRVSHIKEAINSMCLNLYDWSGLQMDPQSLQILRQHHTSLGHMVTLLQNMLDQPGAITVQGRLELETKLSVTTLITQHVAMVLWFYDAGFLPERSEEDELGDEQVAYPAKALSEAYSKHRSEVTQLHPEVEPRDVLMIDSFVGQFGETLTHLWQRDHGNGLYPPPSVNALLNVCLLEGVSELDKHKLLLYTQLDLFNSAPEDVQASLNEKLIQFTQSYNLAPGVVKLVQAMWMLDHKDFEEAILYLLDPMVQGEMLPWQHTVAVKAFLYQGREQLALRYLQVKRPPLTTPEDVKLRLTVLLANGLTAEAFEYQRLCSDQVTGNDLLSHLFTACQQTKTVDHLLHMPFSREEERHLVSYLQKRGEVVCQELLVLYYLQQARYIEAIQQNNKIKQQMHGEMDVAARERARVRNSIVEGYQRVLPSVQRKMCQSGQSHTQRKLRTRREVARPTPLSTLVARGAHGSPVTRASLVRALMQKVSEVKEDALEDPVAGSETLPARLSESMEDQDTSSTSPKCLGPFVNVPITPRPRRRVSQAPDVVFPTPSVPPEAVAVGDAQRVVGMSPLGRRSPLKRPHGVQSPLSAEITRLASTLKRKQGMLTAEALSLLQTPPVRRKTPSKPQPYVAVGRPSTPQSILKVRHSAHHARSPSPRQELLRSTLTDLTLPTPPRPQRLVIPAVGQGSDSESTLGDEDVTPGSTPPHTSSAAAAATPKHLRFLGVSPDASVSWTSEGTAEAGSQEDQEEEDGHDVVVEDMMVEMQQQEEQEEEQEEELELEVCNDSMQLYPDLSGRRNVKERSPTPERRSPLMPSARVDWSPQLSFAMGDAANQSTGEAQSSQQAQPTEEEVYMVDSEVTFNFGDRSHLKPSEPMDVSRDTEPIVMPAVVGSSDVDALASHQALPSDAEDHRPAVLSAVGRGDQTAVLDEDAVDAEAGLIHGRPDEDPEDDLVLILDSESNSSPAKSSLGVSPKQLQNNKAESVIAQCQVADTAYVESAESRPPGLQVMDVEEGVLYSQDMAQVPTGDSEAVTSSMLDIEDGTLSPSQQSELDLGKKLELHQTSSECVHIEEIRTSESRTTVTSQESQEIRAYDSTAKTETVTGNATFTVAEDEEKTGIFAPSSSPETQEVTVTTVTDQGADNHVFVENTEQQSKARFSRGKSQEREVSVPDRVPAMSPAKETTSVAEESKASAEKEADLETTQVMPTTPTRQLRNRTVVVTPTTKKVTRTPSLRSTRKSKKSESLTEPDAEPASSVEQSQQPLNQQLTGQTLHSPRRSKRPLSTSPLRRSPRLQARAAVQQRQAQLPPPRRTPSRKVTASTPTRPLPGGAGAGAGAGDLSLRRSPRLAEKHRRATPSLADNLKTEARASTWSTRKQKGTLFKTPPRPSRVSVMPPTPPESSTSSPASTGSAQDLAVDASPTTAKGDAVTEAEQADDTMTKLRPEGEQYTMGPLTRLQARSRSSSPIETGEQGAGDTPSKTKGRRKPRKSTSRSTSPVATQNGDSLATEDVVNKAPLSQGSYMMRMRTSSMSREGTPESARTSETGSVASTADGDVGFMFSEPVSLKAVRGEEFMASPMQTFIFSPPLTRARRRQSLTDGLGVSLSQISEAALPSKSPASQPSRASKKQRSDQTETIYTPTDSPINFLSPIKEDDRGVGSVGAKQRGAVTRVPAQSMTLRKKFTKKHKQLKW